MVHNRVEKYAKNDAIIELLQFISRRRYPDSTQSLLFVQCIY